MSKQPIYALLQQEYVKAHKKFGQNFILNPDINDKIVSKIAPLQHNMVIEIGPGMGHLTWALLQQHPQHLVAIEKDTRMQPCLDIIKAHAATPFDYILDDAKNIHIEPLIKQYSKAQEQAIIVANLPYNMAQKILLQCTAQVAHIKAMYLMFQHEVALRITAEPSTKNYGRLSVIMQNIFDTRQVITLAPDIFTPKPKVYSTIVEFLPKNNATSICQDDIADITRIAFANKRKMIKKNMQNLEHGQELLQECNIDPNIRPENITPQQYYELALRWRTAKRMG